MLDQAKVELLYGNAAFINANTLEVSGKQVSFKKCVIATGSYARELPNLSSDSKQILSMH